MPPKYKPGGRTFPPKGKPRNFPPQAPNSVPSTSSSSSSSSSTTPSGLNPEAEDQLELELCWCIQQLQTGLGSGKLNEKQIQETTKTLNVLISSTAPLIKKRQAMRNTFGDYRAKMTTDEKKMGKATTQVKFAAATSSENKSMFVRKAYSGHNGPQLDEKEGSKVDEAKTTPEVNDKTMFRMQPSDNSFRFNFSQPEQ